MVKIRDSRIELLRIVLMWTVMAHHFVVHNADSVSVFPSSFTRFFYNIFFYPIGRTAVGCFVAITIWFVAGKAGYSIKQAVKQIALIEGMVLFYSIVLGFFFMLRGDIQVSPTNLIDIFAPTLTGSSWWFVTVYAWLVFFAALFNSGFACVGPETTSLSINLSGLRLWIPALCAALLDSHRRATS